MSRELNSLRVPPLGGYLCFGSRLWPGNMTAL
jgi:hypothetical protein